MNALNPASDFAARFVFGTAQTLWSGTLLAGAAWAVCKLLPRLPAGVRGALWWIVCARFVVGILGAGLAPTPAFAIRLPAFWQAPPQGARRLPAEPSPPVLQTGPQVPNAAQTPTPAPPSTNAAPVSPPADASAPAKTAPLPVPALPQMFLWLWAVGFLGRIALSGIAARRLRKTLGAARQIKGDDADADARALWEAAQKAARTIHHFPVVPRLFLSDAACDALVTGGFAPAILISKSDMTRLTTGELSLILAHEIAHIRRGDLLWGIVPHLAAHLFWFWPPALWACREWGVSCEAACDKDAARAAQTSPRTYGELLLKLGASQSAAPSFAALPASSSFRLLQRRIVMLHLSPVPRSWARRITSGIGVAALVCALPLFLLPVRFAAVAAPAADTFAYAGGYSSFSETNYDLMKPWAVCSDRLQNLDFASGLAHWEQSPNDQEGGFEIGVQTIKAPTPGPSAVVYRNASATGKIGNYVQSDGTLGQYIRPLSLRGKRVRFSAWVKPENAGGGKVFLHLISPTIRQDWEISDWDLVGTKNWKKRTYVFDVPRDADGLGFGVKVFGGGKIWLHAPTFEMVNNTVPVTPPTNTSRAAVAPPYTTTNNDTNKPWSDYPDAPQNLNFDNNLSGWSQTEGDKTRGYTIAAQTIKAPTSKASGLLSGSDSGQNKEGFLAQYARPDLFRGKRVRYSAWVKTEAAQASGFWLRMDTPSWQKAWNMSNAPITGSTDWVKISYVFDVPNDAQGFAFGTNLKGSGKIWLHAPAFEIVPETVPVSDPAFDSSPDGQRTFNQDAANPTNLQFENGLSGWWNDNPDHNADKNYAIGLDSAANPPTGTTSAFIQSIINAPQSYGTLAQNTQATNLRGKRVRFSTTLKTSDAQAAGFWIVVHAGENSTGYNRRSNPITGTTKWTKYETIITIPKNAEGISFGIDLTGTGKVWTNGFSFEVLPDAPPDTKPNPAPAASVPLENPTNLRFQNGLAGWWNHNPERTAGENYQIVMDTQSGYVPGEPVALLQNKVPRPQNYGTLAQTTAAKNLRGKSVRFSADLKTEAAQSAQLWTSVQSPGRTDENSGAVAFPSVTGWKHWEKIMDVPRDATSVSFGISLRGVGKVWVKGFAFESVGDAP